MEFIKSKSKTMNINYLSKSIEAARIAAAEEDFERRSEQYKEFDFNPGDWVVCRLSFGICIIQVEFSGYFDDIHLRLASDDDFKTIQKHF